MLSSRGHSSALSYLKFGVFQGEGFVVVTGEIGAGKTTLVRTLLEGLESDEIVAAQIVSTQLEAGDRGAQQVVGQLVTGDRVPGLRLRPGERAGGAGPGPADLPGAGPVGVLARLDGPHLQVADKGKDRPVDERRQGEVGARSSHREIMTNARDARRFISPAPGARLVAWSNDCHS